MKFVRNLVRFKASPVFFLLAYANFQLVQSMDGQLQMAGRHRAEEALAPSAFGAGAHGSTRPRLCENAEAT
jgi:hypothetical protein